MFRRVAIFLIIVLMASSFSSVASDIDDEILGGWETIPDSPWNEGQDKLKFHFGSWGEVELEVNDGQKTFAEFEVTGDNTITVDNGDQTSESEIYLNEDHMLMIVGSEIIELYRVYP